MQLSKGATVVVADGEKFQLFRNAGDEAGLKLVAVPHDGVGDEHKGSSSSRHGSSANPDGGQDKEDDFSAGVAALLNRKVLDGKIDHLLIVAAPRTLGALRQHYHDKLSAILVGEIAKDLTGHDLHALEKAVAAA